MMRIVEIVFVVALVATTVLHAVEAAVIQVGGDSGWQLPPNPDFYSSWAAGLTFNVGDVLVFNFTTGGHDVAGVTKDSYDNCNTNNPKFLNTTSPFSFTFNKLDDYFFICTEPGHCSAGQKLAITNLLQLLPPGFLDTPVTPPVVTAPPPPPLPPNSVANSMASIFTVAFVSIAVTFIIY